MWIKIARNHALRSTNQTTLVHIKSPFTAIKNFSSANPLQYVQYLAIKIETCQFLAYISFKKNIYIYINIYEITML